MSDEQIITARIPGPGNQIDDYTVMADDVDLDLSTKLMILQWGFQGIPIGQKLEIWQEGDKVFVKAKVDLEGVALLPNVELEFHPGFIVRKWGIIRTAWWKRLWAWLRGLVTGTKTSVDDRRVIKEAELQHISIGVRIQKEIENGQANPR